MTHLSFHNKQISFIFSQEGALHENNPSHGLSLWRSWTIRKILDHVFSLILGKRLKRECSCLSGFLRRTATRCPRWARPIGDVQRYPLLRRAFPAATARQPDQHPLSTIDLTPAAMATGPAAGGLSQMSCSLAGLLSRKPRPVACYGWPTSHIMGARPLTEGQKKMIVVPSLSSLLLLPILRRTSPAVLTLLNTRLYDLMNGKGHRDI